MRLRLPLALALAAGGCRNESPAPQPQTPTKEEPAREAKPPVLPPYAVPAQQGEIVGQLRVADPSALLAKLELVLPPTFVSRLSPDAVRRRLSEGATPVVQAVVEHLDFGRPAGCVLLDPVKRDLPFACVFGYTGGLAQLTTDLGSEARVEDGGGALVVEHEGQRLFFDALDDDIAVAWDAAALPVARETLDVLRRPGATRDLELSLPTAYAAEKYQREVAGLLVAATVAARAEPEAEGPLADLRAELGSLPPEAIELALDAVDELAGVLRQAERVDLYVSLSEDAAEVGLAVLPSNEAPLRQWAERAPTLDPDVYDWLPHGTWLFWADRRHPDGLLLPGLVALRRGVLAHYIGRFIEQPPADVAAAAQAVSAIQDEVYGDWMLFAAYNSPATRGGAMLVRPKQPEVDARQAWLTLARAATPRALFGETLGATVESTVRWSVVELASSVGGLAVDEWRVTAAPDLLDQLDRSLAEGEIGKQIVAALREREALFAVQRFELDDAVVFTFAPGGGDAYASKVIRARRGEGRLDRTGVDTILAGHRTTLAIAGLSAFDLLQAIHEALPPDLPLGLPATAGRNLSDAQYSAYVAADGSLVHRVRMSSSVIELGRDLLLGD